MSLSIHLHAWYWLTPNVVRHDICRRSYEDWMSASVVNHTTVPQPGFDLPRHTWSLVNLFRTGQGPCHANLHKWGLAQSPSWDCGHWQTMNHIVDSCAVTKFEGGLNVLHEADNYYYYLFGKCYSLCRFQPHVLFCSLPTLGSRTAKEQNRTCGWNLQRL